MRYALVRGGVCVTIVESETLPTVDIGGQWVAAADGVGPGWTWNGTAWSAPVVTVRSLTVRAFWRRFTATERETLENKLATGTQVQKDKLNAFKAYLLTGGNVELDDDYIIASVGAMEAAGVIATGRAAQILSMGA
jgi:hypothetical protein